MPKIPLVIFGTGDFADIAYEYFTYDSDFEVVAFTVHQKYIESDSKYNLPVIPFEILPRTLTPSSHHFFAAVTYIRLNDFRSEITLEAKRLGYSLASYVSSRSFVWRNVSFGEHVFVFEDNTIQPFVTIGNNVIMWSGNHVGHHSKLSDNVFISSQVVVSGNCVILENSFLGVNSTISNNVTIGKRSWVGPGALINHDSPDGHLVTGNPGKSRPLDEALLNLKLASTARKGPAR